MRLEIGFVEVTEVVVRRDSEEPGRWGQALGTSSWGRKRVKPKAVDRPRSRDTGRNKGGRGATGVPRNRRVQLSVIDEGLSANGQGLAVAPPWPSDARPPAQPPGPLHL